MKSVVESGMFVLGPAVTSFENAFASYVGVKEAVCMNSGTAALQLGLMAIGLEPGDEVIIPANTFIATAESVVWAGGKPVLVDVSEDDFNMAPGALEAAVTPRTRGIIPVDLYGQPARLDEIQAFADRHGLFLLEDACQAHGARYKGRSAGTFGRAAAFSFYPGKNLGAYGEGGAIVTDDPAIAAKARMLRDHGQSRKYEHALMGHNYRLEGLQGAVLGVKLPHLDGWNDARRRVAGWYRESLAGLPVGLPEERPDVRHVYHLFVIRVPRRDAFQAALKEQGIDTLIHYPIPLHLQPALAGLGYSRGQFPVTERLASEIVSLPIFPELRQEQVQRVGRAVGNFLSSQVEGR
jgi:dTDP-4-amino-4,6-dideoxygalactose transaminase